MPLAKKPDRKNKIDNWAAPKYGAEVEYRDITTEGLLRHTTFKGLYDSKKSKTLNGQVQLICVSPLPPPSGCREYRKGDG
jgi:hypothetical protein